MAETDQLHHDLDETVHAPGDDAPETGDQDRGKLARIRTRAAGVFSHRVVLIAVVVQAAGLLLLEWVGPAVIPFVGLVGVAGASLVLGLGGWRRYVELSAAGGLVSGVARLVGTFGGTETMPVLLVAGAGAIAGAVGHYLGRDLREGFTREL